MALKKVWSKRAENGYDKILRHLEKEWTEPSSCLVDAKQLALNRGFPGD